MTRINSEIKFLTPYTCLSCNAALETDRAGWAEWLVCPACGTPSKLPEPPRRPTRVTAGSFYIGPETTPESPSTGARPRLSWIDEIAPRPLSQNGNASRPPLPPVVPSGPPPQVGTPGQVPPQRPSTGSYGPSPEVLAAALSRPAQVRGPVRPASSMPPNASRIFLGLSLCVSTVAFLFKMLDGDSNWATVWGIAALLSIGLLARPTMRQ